MKIRTFEQIAKDLKEYKECEIHPSETIKNEWIK